VSKVRFVFKAGDVLGQTIGMGSNTTGWESCWAGGWASGAHVVLIASCGVGCGHNARGHRSSLLIVSVVRSFLVGRGSIGKLWTMSGTTGCSGVSKKHGLSGETGGSCVGLDIG
jgi:hypothetical protein